MLRNTFAIALVASVALAKNDKSLKNSMRTSKRDPEDDEFMAWVASNNKDFVDVEDMTKRKGNWKKHKQQMIDLKAKFPKTEFGMNYMSDWDDAELAKLRGAVLDDAEDRRLSSVPTPTNGRKLQGSGDINWANTQFMGPVKN